MIDMRGGKQRGLWLFFEGIDSQLVNPKSIKFVYFLLAI
jgi:hypothetical protein